eukprot:s3052_g1.t1
MYAQWLGYANAVSFLTTLSKHGQRLQQEASVGPGMYAETPKDRTAGVAKAYQVCKSQDHLDAFQSVYRRLRRTGRDAEDKDVSDSMLKAHLGMMLLTNTECFEILGTRGQRLLQLLRFVIT